ncbi:tyrosine-type recombinase/integrase [Bengtsoniella intestinalis]|uniref:tyrosine-type recombinase/integrase n=1 Tax=Bengtsoniella intestinalis TaxID=3073143 RepID=UPI00391F8FB6
MASIRKRGNNFTITISLGRGGDGKQLLKHTTFTPDPSLTPKQKEKAATAYAIQLENQFRTGQILTDSKITVTAFCEQWLANHALPQMTTGTYEKTDRIIQQQIIPHLGHIRLSDLRKLAIVQWMNQLSSDTCVRYDDKTGAYAKSTIQRYFGVLHSLLQTAVDWELIATNPSNAVKLPKDHSANANEDIECLSFEDVTDLLTFMQMPYRVTVSGHTRTDDTGLTYQVPNYTLKHNFALQDKLLIHLAIDTGMRKQEILALTWKVIDFHKNTIQVKQAVSKVKGKEVIKALKNKHSKRTMTISEESISLLQAWRAEQVHCRKTLGSTYNADDWVFIRPTGERLGYSTPYQVLKKVLRHYNSANPETPLPTVSFHALRHTCATLLLASGIDIREVAARLGHAETSTALNIYIHSLPSSDKAAANKMNAILALPNPSNDKQPSC